MSKYMWSSENTKALYDLRKLGLTYNEIASKLDPISLSAKQCKQKYSVMNWDAFFGVGETEIKKDSVCWEDSDLIQIYTLKKAGVSISEISKKAGKSKTSISMIFNRHPDWEKELEVLIKKGTKKTAVTQDVIDSVLVDNLVKAMIEIARHDIDRLKALSKESFYSKVTIDAKSPISFTELKKRATYELSQIGLSYPSSKVFGKGTYIIVGDSHGKHTRSGMFKLLKNLNDHLKATRIIHVGHYIDDDNDINYNWADFTNLTIVAKEEEVKFLAKQNITADIVRKEIILGEKLSVQNQDLITDYVQSPLSRAITPEYFECSTITNLHRHEFDTRCTEEGINTVVASPGCLCERHIVYTIKQQDFTDGRVVKQTFPVGYKKYRRMEHQYKTWQQGILVVHIDSKGDYSIICCRVHLTSKGYTTSYFDKIISEKGIFEPDEKTLVSSDIHADLHDHDVLDITEQICNHYKPDVHVNLGDISNNTSINHHIFKQIGCMRVKKSLLDEAATTHFILKRMSNFAKRKILLLGNHERFFEDWYLKFPQFEELLNFKFLNDLSDMHIEVINLKQTKRISNVMYQHGDLQMFGQTGGNRLDKIFRTYGRNVILGHCHFPSHRNDCYTIGLSGKLNLDYNEVCASKWMHSIGIVNTFEDTAFITNICIVDNKTSINGKTYTPANSNNWNIPQFKAKISFEYGEPKSCKSKQTY